MCVREAYNWSMVEFWIGFMVAGLIGGAFAYRCFEGRELSEAGLKQTVDRLRLEVDEVRLDCKQEKRNAEVEKEELVGRIDVQRKRIEKLETEKFDLTERLARIEEGRKPRLG